MINITKVKQYLKIDTTAEDEYLNLLITSTNEYISSSIDNFTSSDLSDNAQLMLIGMLYNNRGLTGGQENKTLKLIFDAILLKLKTKSNEQEETDG